MSDRVWWALQAALVAIVASWVVARAQDLPPQPDLDLPVRVEGYMPGALAVPVRPAPGDDDVRDQPPPVFFGEAIAVEGSTLVYVIDVSGSMSYRDRIGTAKRELTRSIQALVPGIQFNLVAYGCSIKTLWPKVRRADDAAKSAAVAWVQQLEANGGTATGPAAALALQDRKVSALALLTDGEPNCGCESGDLPACHRRMIAAANTQGATVNTFKIGSQSGGYAEALRAFCRAVAEDSGGAFVEIPDR